MAKEKATAAAEKKVFNGKVTIDKVAKTVTIVMPLQTPKLSGSGKNFNIATSSGNYEVKGCTYKNKQVTAGVNVYYPADEAEE